MGKIFQKSGKIPVSKRERLRLAMPRFSHVNCKGMSGRLKRNFVHRPQQSAGIRTIDHRYQLAQNAWTI